MKSEYTPMHERKRRAAIKRNIAALERSVKAAWKRFEADAKHELVGSPRYDHLHRNTVLHTRDLEFEIGALMLRLPPHLVWNDFHGCLERVLVDHAHA